jgi:hypothetical protein
MSKSSLYDDIPDDVKARCPICKKRGVDEVIVGPKPVDEAFGYRRVPAPKSHAEATKRIPQSYCRTHRAEMSKLARQKKKEKDASK